MAPAAARGVDSVMRGTIRQAGACRPWKERLPGAGPAMARSAEGEQARTPGARIAGARGSVTAAAAVTHAHVALAPLVHAVDQFLAAAGQPVGATDLVRRQCAPLRR